MWFKLTNMVNDNSALIDTLCKCQMFKNAVDWKQLQIMLFVFGIKNYLIGLLSDFLKPKLKYSGHLIANFTVKKLEVVMNE